MQRGARKATEMQVNVAGIRRNLKNLAHNYSDAQIKVREATSNDPWGTSSTLMSEIADLTYNVVAFSEIMQMIWKRLNDHGRNWRHVYKALVLLEYLIKTGTEKVAQQCRENIFAIETLKDFQYQEGTKDQGMNVREKAKQLVSLLRDDERLKNERARALKARERFAQASSGFGSDSHETTPTSPTFPGYTSYSTEAVSQELESARPQTAGEEELQLQLALAMSREEAEQEEQRRRSDDVRLQLALSQSEQEYRHKGLDARHNHLLDLLEVSLGGGSNAAGAMPSSQSAPAIATDPWGMPQIGVASSPTAPTGSTNDPWSSPVAGEVKAATSSPPVDPWIPVSAPPARNKDPWIPPTATTPPTPTPAPTRANDPWSPVTNQSSGAGTPGRSSSALGSPTNGELDEFDVITNRERLGSGINSNVLNNNTSGTTSPNPFDLSPLTESLPDDTSSKKTPASFLGENSSLVNLDNLVAAKPPSVPGSNPFALTNPGQPNPFQQQQQAPRPSINQMRHQQFVTATSVSSLDGWVSPSFGSGSDSGGPRVPSAQASRGSAAASPQPLANNPFLA